MQAVDARRDRQNQLRCHLFSKVEGGYCDALALYLVWPHLHQVHSPGGAALSMQPTTFISCLPTYCSRCKRPDHSYLSNRHHPLPNYIDFDMSAKDTRGI